VAIASPSCIRVSCAALAPSADLTASAQARVEIHYIGSAATPSMTAMGAEVHATGEAIRALLPDANLDAAIDAIRRARARLISVTPVRTTLEDYFVAKLGADAALRAGWRGSTGRRREGPHMTSRLAWIAYNTFAKRCAIACSIT